MAQSGLSKGAYDLFRCRRTIHEMLRDRGYLVDQTDIDMSEDDFKEKFGEAPMREQLTVLVQQREDPTQQAFVFWPQDPKVGVKPIKRCAPSASPTRVLLGPSPAAFRPTRSYVERMNEDEVKKAILVVQQAMTAFAKQAIVEICAQEGLTLEWFMVRAHLPVHGTHPHPHPHTHTLTHTPTHTPTHS